MTHYQTWDKQALIDEIASLKKRKKYGLNWENKPEDIVRQCREKLPVLEEVKGLSIHAAADNPATNLLIEGDNYHALSVLNYTHKGKIDVIYIDPPYNTGAKDWKYNNNYIDKTDGYRHSKWLSMMSNRLALAKKLLKKDGVLICTIDENERPRIELLLEELFADRTLTSVSVVHNPQGAIGGNFSYTHEYALFVLPKIKGRISKIDVEPRTEGLRDDTGNFCYRTNAKNCFYPIHIRNNTIIGFGDVPADDFHPQGRIIKRKNHTEVWPLRDGVERKWRYARQSVGNIKADLIVKQTKRGDDIFQIKKRGTPKTVWIDPRYHAGGKYGTKFLDTVLGERKFNHPKSLYSVVDALKITTGKNSTVLDFFAGSGTTGHAVSVLNKEDGGNRRFILCTNNENGIARTVCRPRIKAVIKGHSAYLDITGIPSNLKYFKTAFVAAAPTDRNKAALTRKAAEMLCIKEGTYELVKETAAYKIYRNENRYTGIIHKPTAITAFKKAIAKIDGKISVYTFSFSDDDFSELFTGSEQVVKLRPIPKIILQAYRQIFK